jgi:parallel beta-helix repeat protein
MSSQLVLSHSGTASAPVIYRNDGGTALLQYTGPVAVGGLLQTVSYKHWRGAHDIVFDGLTIDGADRIDGGIFVTQGAHHVTIENCVIRNTGSSGISLNATDYVTVTGNQIYHAGYANGWSSGISLWYGGPTHVYGGRTAWYGHAQGVHNFIVDNIVSGTYDNSHYHSDGNGIIVDGSRSIPPVLIANNLVYENGGAGIAVFSTFGQVWIVNNTAYANGLDLSVDAGEAAEYQVIKAANVHLVNDVAYGRQNRANYSYAYVYRNVASSITWLGDIAYNGTTAGVQSSILGNRRDIQNVDPAFVDPPPVPKAHAPWSSAVPPWEIGHALDLRPDKAVVQTGVDLIASKQFAAALVPGLRRYLTVDIASRTKQ